MPATFHARALSATALTPAASPIGTRVLHGALIASLLLAPVGASAQQSGSAVVTIDPSQTGAGAPKKDMAPSGVPVVKIATPSAKGVSHNRYTDFNVDARGLILNNSGTIVATELAGYIDGNGNLKASGPAKIILNEVTGTRGSTLGGYLEVAGAPAGVVIANPYGIQCSGCGFLNTPDVTLVAGRATLDGTGGIAGYRVDPEGGALSVTGQGLDASGARLAMFARAIAVNAGVWADKIDAAYGAGAITATNGDIVVTAKSAAQPGAPAVALDVAALGGMYANAIRLVGTEAGLGVKVDGHLAGLENGVSLSADGRVEVGGRITSAGNVDIRTSDALAVPGTVFADGAAHIAAASIENAGLIASTGDMAVTTGALAGTGTLAAGLARDGTLGATGDLSITSSGPLSLSGSAVAAGTLAVDAGSVTIDGRVQVRDVALTTRAGSAATGALSIGTTGDVRAQNSVSVSSGSLVLSGVLAGHDISIATGAFDNAGITAASGALTVDAGAATVSGTLQSGSESGPDGTFAFAADSLSVTGGSLASLATGAMTLDVAGPLAVTDGEIGANGALAITASSIDVRGAGSRITGATGLTADLAGTLSMNGGALVSGGDAAVRAGAIDVTAGDIRAAGALSLTASTLAFGADALAAGGSLDITGASLSNTGTLASTSTTGPLDIALTGALTNDGLIQANGTALNIGAASLANGGDVIHAGSGTASVAAADIVNTGRIASNAALELSATTLANSGELVAQNALSATGSTSLTNSGTVASGGDVAVSASQFSGAGGSVEAGGALSLTGGAIDLGDGRYVAAGAAGGPGSGALTIAATNNLTASAAIIGGNGDISLSALSTLALGGFRVTALGSILLDSGTSLTLGGQGVVAAAGSVSLQGGATVDATATLIQAGVEARFAGTSVILDDAIVEAGGFAFDTNALSLRRAKLRHTGTDDFALTSSGTLDYSGGEIYSAGTNFSIDAASLVNQGGAILHAGSGALTIDVAGHLNNRDGRIATNGALALTAGHVDTGGGTITAAAGASLASAAGLVNDGGLIASGSGMTLTAGDLSNLGGAIEAQSTLGIRAANYAGTGGSIVSIVDPGTIGASIPPGGSGSGAALTMVLSGAVTGAGLIGSDGEVDVAAGSITLGTGDRITGSAMTLRTTGGDIALGGAQIDGGSVALDAGARNIVAGTGGLVLASDALSLRGGTIDLSGAATQGQTVTLAGGNLVNSGGIVNALGSLDATFTGAIDNKTGEIYSAGALGIAAASLDNAGGIIASANGPLSVALTGAAGLANGGGEIASGGSVAIDAAAIDNRSGSIVSGVAGLALTATNSIRNDGGTLGGSGDVRATAASLDNGTGTVAAANNLAINAASLTNAVGGAIWADRDAHVTVTGTLFNRGSIGADRDLVVTAGTLDNGLGDTAGVLYATRQLSLAYGVGTLGKTVAGDDLALTFAGDFTNGAGQSMISLGTLSLDIGGDFANEGRIEGALGVAIDAAGNIVNAATGEIVGPVVDLSAGGALTNAGLINAGTLASLSADSIVNEGRIYGDSVIAEAATSIINRGNAAVIAARSGTIALHTPGTIENRDRAMIYSLGDIAIAGADASGSAASLLNSSASIEAQGDIVIAAKDITNDRTSYTVGQQTTTTSADNPPPGGYATTPFPGGVLNSQTTTTVTEDVLASDSGAGRIIAGGDITIETDALLNRYSTISAGGSLLINGGPGSSTSPAVTNLGLAGTRTTETREESEVWICLDMSGGMCRDYDTVYSSSPPATTTETITVAPAIIAAGSIVSIDAQSIDNVILAGGTNGDFSASAAPGSVTSTTLTASGGAVAVRDLAGVAIAGVDPTAIAIEPVTVPGLTPATIGLALTPVSAQHPGSAPVFSADLGGLFRFAPANANYLIETDPAFTGYGSFLSSDYFLTRLGLDPARVQRRLGDALYEQQLITKQLTAQTGAARLGGYGDNEAQYRALMDAGVLVARAFNLAPGIGLSAEQMATLTTSIVLLVEVEVTGPDGKPVKALVPRVYLARVDSRDMSGAAVIAGNDVRLRSADALTNSGVIRATATSHIAAGSIANAGTIDFGKTGFADVRGDLVSSGAIRGGDLAIRTGGDLRLEPMTTTSTVATAWRADKKHYDTRTVTTLVNRPASLVTTGDLAIDTGGLFAVKGSDVRLGGDMDVFARGGIDIASAVDTSTTDYAGRSGKTKYSGSESRETNRLSTIDVGGDANFATPGAFTVKGGEVNADGALGVSAGSIAVSGVTDTASYERDTVTKKSGLLSSKKTTTHSEGVGQSVIASTLSGDKVRLASTGDTSILGSNVVASNGVSIATGGDLTVGAIAATDSEEHSTRVKKSGISISGGGLFAGVAKSTTENEATSVTHTGSLIGSEKGDVTLDAGKALTVSGSQVVGTGTTTLSGESVAIEHVTDTVDTSSLQKSSSFGVSIGASSSIIDGVKTASRTGEIASSGAANDRTKAVAGIAGGLAASNTVDAVKADPGALGGATLSASLGFSKSKSTSESHDETVVGSNIAGTDVNLVARGDGTAGSGALSVTGSDVTASRDLTIAAAGPVSFASATETDTMSGQAKSSGASIGVSVGVGTQPNGQLGTGTPSVNLSVSGSKSRYEGETVTHRESNLAAGGTARVTTPDALTLKGATLSGERVEVAAGSLSIESEQDTSTYASREKSGGLNASVSFSGQVSVSGNLGKGKQDGDFASVAEQSGIYAGKEGFDIKVGGATDLKGAVIASEADASKNSLTTGTLTASDIANRESYSASSTSISAGIGANLSSKDGTNINTDGQGRPLSGIKTGIGTVSATPPVAMSAKGGQSGTTVSAIAPGAITITSGDAASQQVAQSISRDTEAANAGALTQEYDDAKRQEIALGFEASRTLTGEVGSFLANRARDEAAKKKEADAARKAGDLATAARLDKEASDLNGLWGGGGPGNIVLTALTGAASGNVTGSMSDLVRAASVNVLQSLATTQAKALADSVQGGDAASEGARAALQALVGCTGAAAGGSGDCGSAAMGASASAVLNYLLSSAGAPKDEDRNGNGQIDPDERIALEDQQARTNLVATIVTAIASAAGIDASSANTAAQIETQNNELNWEVKPGLTLEEAKASLAAAKKQIAEHPEDSAESRKAEQELIVYIAELEMQQRDQSILDALQNSSDPFEQKLGEALAQTSPEVRAELYKDAENRDGGLLGEALASALSPLLSDKQKIAIVIADAEQRLQNHNNLQDYKASIRANADAEREKVAREAQKMRDEGRIADAAWYEIRRNDEIASNERYLTNLANTGQALNQFTRDIEQGGIDMAQGAFGSAAAAVEAIFSEERSAAEIYRDVKDKLDITIENFEQMTPAEQGRAIGNLRGDLAAELTKAAATAGAGGVAGKVLTGGTRAGATAATTDTAEAAVRKLLDEANEGSHQNANHSGGLGGDGPYNPQEVQSDLENIYGKDNVTSTTLPPSDSRFPALAGTSQTLADGTRIVFDNRGFPIFDDIAKYETRITMTPDNRPMDLRAATRDLRQAIDEGRVDANQFEPDQLAAIQRGDAQIPRLTWHHHQDRGGMQLVPRDIHSKIDHIGSVSLNKGP